ncbi:hypothetical protein ACIRBX_08610 [Kitasatospora sp. NPDC096147]|uniref:hypothetical protein n=1 Tax=Kitasatospora sp. NPDC096147 TaxID=3364093 RepID=UPI00380EF433
MRIPAVVAAVVVAALVPVSAQAAEGDGQPYARDLSVSVAAPQPSAPGEVVPFTVVVCNQGSEDLGEDVGVVVNGPPDEGMELTSESWGVQDSGWNWIGFRTGAGLRAHDCIHLKLRARTLAGMDGSRTFPGGTAQVFWDADQDPSDNLATWTSEITAPVTGAFLALTKQPAPTAPGGTAEFQVEESNLGPSVDYPWRGRVVAQLPPGSSFLPTQERDQCEISADGTTAVCPYDIVSNTWRTAKRDFAVRVGEHCPSGGTVRAVLTYEAPADPPPHAFVLNVDIPVL